MAAIMETGGDKANRARNKFRNSETAITILKGAPCFYQMDGSGDGADVISAEGLAVAVQNLFAGIALTEIGLGKIREGQVHGLCTFVRVVTTSRAATSDVWLSNVAGVLGDVLSVVSASNAQGFSRAGVGSVGILSPWVLAQAYVSVTTQASSLGSGLFSVQNLKVFIRTM